MPPSFTEAIHLVSGSAAAGQLMGAGARERIFRTDDILTSGPCDVDPVRHAELRRSWDREAAPGVAFRHPMDLADLRTAIAGDDPVVLWGARAYSDVVWLWWALDGLGRIGAERSRLLLARPQIEDPRMPMGCSTPDETRIALAEAHPITQDEWREAGQLWIDFASPSPLAFDEASRAGSRAFPELTTSAEPHGAWFPRLVGGRLRLSELDELLLGCTDDAWHSDQELLDALSDDHRAKLLSPCDHYFHVERLRTWATHGVLEREVAVAKDDLEKLRGQDRFRATARTRALVDNGLDGIGDAPVMYVGGCRVNDPASPWVRIESDSDWRLALAAD